MYSESKELSAKEIEEALDWPRFHLPACPQDHGECVCASVTRTRLAAAYCQERAARQAAEAHAREFQEQAKRAGDRIDEVEAGAAAVQESLKAKADRAYCDYIAVSKTTECLGWEAKVKAGQFGTPELAAHERAAELLGTHRGLMQAVSTLSSDAGRATLEELEQLRRGMERRAKNTQEQRERAEHAEAAFQEARDQACHDCRQREECLKEEAARLKDLAEQAINERAMLIKSEGATARELEEAKKLLSEYRNRLADGGAVQVILHLREQLDKKLLERDAALALLGRTVSVIGKMVDSECRAGCQPGERHGDTCEEVRDLAREVADVDTSDLKSAADRIRADGWRKAALKVQDICSEFGDDPKACLGILGEWFAAVSREAGGEGEHGSAK